MTQEPCRDRSLLRPNRLEALSDGVYSIAMTILVLELVVPVPQPSETEAQLAAKLAAMWPQFLNYGVSFIILGVFWVLNTHQSHLVDRTDRVYLWWNLWVLMMVVLVPFNTSLQTGYPDLITAETLFHLNLLAAGMGLYLAWRHACRAGLIALHLKPEEALKASHLALILPLFSVVGLPLGFVLPNGSVLLYLFAPMVLGWANRRWWLKSDDGRRREDGAWAD